MNPIMKRNEKKDSAVSPVVGVMLMLVVTIIIAAIVAAFAGGLATDIEKSPTVALNAEVDSAFDGAGSVFITNLNGDTLDLNKVTVTVYNSTSANKEYIHPSKAMGCGQYLSSGATLNVAYGAGYDYLTPVCNVTSGEDVRIIVVYDDQYVLYDKEVVAL